jgi:transcriptional regulator with XRE-family HTH domain
METNKPVTIADWKKLNPLRQWRKEKGYTRPEVATVIRSPDAGQSMSGNVSVTTLQNWEGGMTKPSPEMMDHIATAMRTEVRELRSAWTRWLNKRPEVAS